MSKAALYDAFIAGWTSYKQGAGWDGLDEAFEKWWTQAVNTTDRAPLTAVDQRRQGMSCGCQGTDDYCPCQNVRLK